MQTGTSGVPGVLFYGPIFSLRSMRQPRIRNNRWARKLQVPPMETRLKGRPFAPKPELT